MQESQHTVSFSEDRAAALDRMVLSASGWRAVFGGTDHSLESGISVEHRDLVAAAARTYAAAVSERAGDGATVVLAADTRPTGPAILDTALRAFIVYGLNVRFLGVAATPEVLAWVASDNELDGFFYVSASHNPPGHNGMKMGFADGAVMPASEAGPLIERFRSLSADQTAITALVAAVAQCDPVTLDRIVDGRRDHKAAALAAYQDFALRCGAGAMPSKIYDAELRRGLDRTPVGVVAELNGSARTESIDRTFLSSFGVPMAIYNDRAGTFSHQILPEGAGLTEARELLELHGARDPQFAVAYVPDNDGDRGNLVFRSADGRVQPLEAQAVFALAVVSQLAWARYLEERGFARIDQLTVVANGPTSLRVDEICRRFGAELHRVEVGEANVVAKARELMEAGAMVAVLGEGSNGGTIVPPARVRDPINTLQALLKYQVFDLHRFWAVSSGANTSGSHEHGADFLAMAESLPRFTTLETDDPRAKMEVGPIPHRDLKARYEAALDRRIPEILPVLQDRYGAPVSWRIENYEATRLRLGAGNRTGAERGGLRILFSVESAEHGTGEPVAAVWMRGSGTEPVFRVLADCRGEDTALLDTLIDWQRRGVTAAAIR